MGVMRTSFLVPFLCCMLSEHALAHDTLAMRVAGCIGRFSAEVEYSWLKSSPDSDMLETRRNSLEAILEAVVLDVEREPLLAHRIDVKFAHSQLLRIAGFSRDQEHAAWARARSSLFLESCSAMLLDS